MCLLRSLAALANLLTKNRWKILTQDTIERFYVIADTPCWRPDTHGTLTWECVIVVVCVTSPSYTSELSSLNLSVFLLRDIWVQWGDVQHQCLAVSCNRLHQRNPLKSQVQWLSNKDHISQHASTSCFHSAQYSSTVCTRAPSVPPV